VTFRRGGSIPDCPRPLVTGPNVLEIVRFRSLRAQIVDVARLRLVQNDLFPASPIVSPRRNYWWQRSRAGRVSSIRPCPNRSPSSLAGVIRCRESQSSVGDTTKMESPPSPMHIDTPAAPSGQAYRERFAKPSAHRPSQAMLRRGSVTRIVLTKRSGRRTGPSRGCARKWSTCLQ
jgi:hypothetical protein